MQNSSPTSELALTSLLPCPVSSISRALTEAVRGSQKRDSHSHGPRSCGESLCCILVVLFFGWLHAVACQRQVGGTRPLPGPRLDGPRRSVQEDTAFPGHLRPPSSFLCPLRCALERDRGESDFRSLGAQGWSRGRDKLIQAEGWFLGGENLSDCLGHTRACLFLHVFIFVWAQRTGHVGHSRVMLGKVHEFVV